MKLVIKIGGQAAEDAKIRRDLARQIAELRRAGHDTVIVHGGGQLLTEALSRMDIPTEFANGLRVTDAETRDVALMVLAGMVNKQWVAAIQGQGQAALGICGGDAKLMEARLLKLPAGIRRLKGLGFVGRPSKVNLDVLEMAFERRIVPVVASLALGPRNEYFNVNADDFAAALARALPADRLIYATESGGVWDAERKLLAEVRAKEIRGMIRKGIVRDGMIPKLLSCAVVLAGGVREIDMVSSSTPNSLLRVLNNRENAGTRIVK